MITLSRLAIFCTIIAILGCLTGVSSLTPVGSGAGPVVAKPFTLPDRRMTFIRIPNGEFLMGSPPDEPSRGDDETQHKVTLAKPFYIQTTEVSQQQYEAVMGENPSNFKGGDLPVENVSWSQAAAFCYELSRLEGKKFRLPSEAEWEYAARAGAAGMVAGTGNLDEMVWYADNSGFKKIDSATLWDTDPSSYFAKLSDNGCRSRSVGIGRANAWGLYDMQGNVSEWVADWYSKDYYRDPAANVDPTGPKKSDLGSRVIRGGSWGSDPRSCRLAKRDYNVPSTQSGSCGFRIAMDAD